MDTVTALAEAISAAGLKAIDAAALAKFSTYLDLILKWNGRTNLTSVRSPDQIVERHFVECIACAQALPESIESLLDFGSGAGFPGIPIAICRPAISVNLAESQNKKSAFLRESVRQLGLTAQVFSQRAEELEGRFDGVTLRAVDRMSMAVPAAARLVSPEGVLVLMTTRDKFPTVEQATPEFFWEADVPLPGSDRRWLRLGRRTSAVEMFHVEQ